MRKVILITDVRFWEKFSGHRARIATLIEYLSSRVELTVVCTGPENVINDQYLQKMYSASFIFLERNSVLSSHGYKIRLKKLIKNLKFEVVILEYIHTTFFLDVFNYKIMTILDCHDIISERTAEFKKYNFQGTFYELSKEIELKILRLYDYIVVLCQPDFQKLRKAIPEKKVLLCSHPPKVRVQRIRKVVKCIAFLGSDYPPNTDGINNFIKTIWPYFNKRYDMHLNIYGSVCNVLTIEGQTGISLMGVVENLNEIYKRTDIIINPVRFGAGLKIKNLEALAHGIPLVTTTHSSRGIETLAGVGMLIADNATDFISAIESLILDLSLRKQISYQGQLFIRKQFSAEKCFQQLFEVL